MAVLVSEPKFEMLEEVYHITKDSPIGVIVNINYSFASGKYSYVVAFGPMEEDINTYYDFELSKTKTF